MWLLLLLTAEPELNAKNPNSKIAPPRATSGLEWPCSPLVLLLGPVIIQPTRPQVPPNRWTTPLPAKSKNPKLFNQPWAPLWKLIPDQLQYWATGYIQPKKIVSKYFKNKEQGFGFFSSIVLEITMGKIKLTQNWHLSTTVPETIDTTARQNTYSKNHSAYCSCWKDEKLLSRSCIRQMKLKP